MSATSLKSATDLGLATHAEVARLRTAGALGAGGRLVELFDYLIARSAQDRAPKESEIAVAVFGKTDADSLRDDPVARVYIHRLRRRLDDFYLRNGTPSGVRLDIPKGDYRVVCRRADENADEADALAASGEGQRETGPASRARKRTRRLIFAAATLVLAGNVAAWSAFVSRPQPAIEITQTSIWSDIAASDRPLLIVVGDYYMFGEYEDRLSLKRLIRDFAINSKEDLVQSQLGSPETFDRYSDVAMQYLPASAAYALADLAPLLSADRKIQVMLASELTSDRLKSDDIIYVGLLSGMGVLRDPVFARSRFQFGESFDQIIDRSTRKVYNSEAFLAAPTDTMYRDYGFFSTFAGPNGNRIVVMSGSRDTAMMGVAEKLTRVESIGEVEKKSAGAQDFEMLFEVKGQKHVNLETHPLASYEVNSASIWTGADTTRFPAK